jgi:flavin-dependent dehydrogenase
MDTVTGRADGRDDLQLTEGSRVAVIGGGPAGSLTSYFLLQMAEMIDVALDVEIFEPRDFSQVAPKGCNMCGGIISETLVQNLAAEGITLPSHIVRRGVQSYVLHMDVGSVRIEPPLAEKRIASVYRGAGPRDLKVSRWDSFDHHLQRLAEAKGARVTRSRVDRVTFDGPRPTVAPKEGDPREVDLVVVAVGVNSSALKLFEGLDLGYRPPTTTKTFIREYHLGEDVINATLGDAMHVFLLNIPRLEFAAIIPKGDYVTVCLLGEAIDSDLVEAFLTSPQVRSCMPSSWSYDPKSCQCAPKISVVGAPRPYADRLVFVGDCGVTRLYKDGIGAAYRTAKACASTAIFEGISADSFRRHYWPVCRSIRNDNTIGKLSFAITRQFQRRRFARRALLGMTAREQGGTYRTKDMSQVMWDMFTGSAPYREVVTRTLHPRFLARLSWEFVRSSVSAAGVMS